MMPFSRFVHHLQQSESETLTAWIFSLAHFSRPWGLKLKKTIKVQNTSIEDMELQKELRQALKKQSAFNIHTNGKIRT